MSRRHLFVLLLHVVVALSLVAACSDNPPTNPSEASAALHDSHLMSAEQGAVNSADHGDKGYIDGWFNGETVQLYYMKSYFCAEPPSSGATTNCEVGAGAEIEPRPGPIPTIYAIAAAGGIQPAPETLACLGLCLNHPAMIDISRIRPGVTNGPALPHSHILAERHAGWFNTVNIRVTNLDVWNQIASAKTLQKVRELQADPEIGGRGLISQDTPTNIFFFIASWR